MSAPSPVIEKRQIIDISHFGAGIGDAVNENELMYIASKPELVYRVGNFESLPEIYTTLGNTACDEPVGKTENLSTFHDTPQHIFIVKM